MSDSPSIPDKISPEKLVNTLKYCLANFDQLSKEEIRELRKVMQKVNLILQNTDNES